MKSWKKEAVGVEIFAQGGRFVKLGLHQDKIELKDFGEKCSKRGFWDFEWLAGELGRAMFAGRVKISFLGQSSQSCRLRPPAEVLSGGEEQLKWELGQKVPSPGSAYDFFIHSVGEESFLGTAVRKAELERAAAFFVKKGGTDLSFTSAAFALVNLFKTSGLSWEDSVALVNLAEDFTTLVILDRGKLTYVSEVATPPGIGSEPEGELAATQKLLRESLVERFGVELSTLLHLLGFRATEAGRIGTVYLSGPGAASGDLSASIGQIGGVRVGHLTCPAIAFPGGEMPERWGIATGLALAALNEENAFWQPCDNQAAGAGQ